MSLVNINAKILIQILLFAQIDCVHPVNAICSSAITIKSLYTLNSLLQPVILPFTLVLYEPETGK